MDNIYIPPKFKTVTPPIEHHRTTPDRLHIDDDHRRMYWTNFDEKLIKAIRRIKNQ